MFRSRNPCRFLRKGKNLSLLVSTVCLGDRSLSTIFWEVENVRLSLPLPLYLCSMNRYCFSAQFPTFTMNNAAADVLLWRNKKISAGVLTGATAIWVLFEWLNYHLLSLVCFALALGMLAQFVWINASGLINRSVKCFLILLLVVSVPIICDSNFCFINDFSLSQVSISGPSPCTTWWYICQHWQINWCWG